MNPNKKNIKPGAILKLKTVFQKHAWVVEDNSLNEASLFNRFCSILGELDEEQQEFIIELTNRFVWLRFENYYKHFDFIFQNILQSQTFSLNNITNIYFAPLILPEDKGKTKSSTMVLYMLKGNNTLRYNATYAQKLCKYFEDLDFDADLVNKQHSILFLVDDFIGTGETASTAINYLVNTTGVQQNKIVVLSIAAMKHGLEEVSNMGIKVFTAFEYDKGISNYYPSHEAAEKLFLMKSIENKLSPKVVKINENERLGYRGSEALITLIRTPNNTFPVFWKQNKKRIAPFPR
ncbi:uracil phosphoribosyltransferase [Paenibacillus andongensis]|uniref:uracil phosphoribosyltransferase n=1 Tax=Paenibacillus andongensis TaxID=2975482 RepID=UPI0021BB553C|nr:uracil phosphoribosyltransferase [Paenibacillus andongensis]